MKSSQDALRAEMKSGQEALGKRLDDLNERMADTNATMLVLFTCLIALIVALFGYMIWDRRTMMKPVSEKLHQFEREVTSDLDLNHSDGSLLRRQLQVMKKFADKNPEFAEIMRGEALNIISILHVSDCDFFPRTESQSQVVQPGSNDHNQISKTFNPVSAFVFNNSVPFDTTDNMLYSDPYC